MDPQNDWFPFGLPRNQPHRFSLPGAAPGPRADRSGAQVSRARGPRGPGGRVLRAGEGGEGEAPSEVVGGGRGHGNRRGDQHGGGARVHRQLYKTKGGRIIVQFTPTCHAGFPNGQMQTVSNGCLVANSPPTRHLNCFSGSRNANKQVARRFPNM